MDVHAYPPEGFQNAVEESFTGHVTLGVGGCAYNHLRALRALGGEGRLFSPLADDAAGRFITGQLASEGVSTEYVLPLLSQTNRTLLVVDGNGDKKIVHHPAEMPDFSRVCRAFLDDLRRYPHVHLSPNPWTIDLIGHVGSETVSISADLQTKVDLALSTGLMERLAVVFFSAVGREDVRASLAAVLGRGPDVAICTDGANGCFVGLKGSPLVRHFPAFQQPEPILDTVAAGDVFAATFLYYLYRQTALEEAVARAQLQAGRSCTARGFGGLLSSPQLDALYSQMVDEYVVTTP